MVLFGSIVILYIDEEVLEEYGKNQKKGFREYFTEEEVIELEAEIGKKAIVERITDMEGRDMYNPLPPKDSEEGLQGEKT
jgi:hypothetical protein